MISCEACQTIVNTYVNAANELFDSTITDPDCVHGATNTCEKCGRSWTIVCHTLDYEGDIIPEGAVEVSDNRDVELTEQEAREAMEGL